MGGGKNMIEDCIPFLVGNVSEQTKNFLQGTKVYCFPPQWGDGYERVMVIGRHRVSKRFIQIILPSRKIKNWRIKQVYSPNILKQIMLSDLRRWKSESEILQHITQK